VSVLNRFEGDEARGDEDGGKKGAIEGADEGGHAPSCFDVRTVC
jgi:hypothetical protein